MLHRLYTPLLDEGQTVIPDDMAAVVRALVARRNVAPEDEIEAIDAEIVGRTYWYVVRPDEIARAVVGRRWRISVAEATLVLVACGEAGYDITGNGAPQHVGEYLPTRGAERDRLLWEAAAYWAHAATQHITYVSLGAYVSPGDSWGLSPRPVQYDQPGSMHPGQQALLTFGPESSAYMRRHTRRLLIVTPEV